MLQIATPRPLDHRIAIGALRGLSADAIGDRLDLPTEYVERRLDSVFGASVTAPGIEPTLPNRILADLEDAAGEPVTVDTLMCVVDGEEEVTASTFYDAVRTLNRRGHRVVGNCRYALIHGPSGISGKSIKLQAIVRRLRQGMASRRELNDVLGCASVHDVNVYVHRLRSRGALIERHSTYALLPTQVLS